MGEIGVDTVMIRHLQGLLAVLSHFPPGGAAHRLFEAALNAEADHGKMTEMDSEAALRSWLEDHWGENADGGVANVAEMQRDPELMTRALHEFADVSSKLHPLTG